jgi:hypothetical protein
VTFVVSIPRESAWQLAQLIKRITFSRVRENARDDGEAYVMLGALNAIGRELADYHGIAPR